MPTQKQIPIVWSIDVEPDYRGGPVERTAQWDGFAATARWLDGHRGAIEEVTRRPATFCWMLRMDPAIEVQYGSLSFAVDAHETLIGDLAARGDRFGLHTHAWREHPTDGWIDDYRDTGWIDHCIETAFATYAATFDRHCRFTRMGHFRLTPEMLETMIGVGCRIDMSLEGGKPPNTDRPGARVRGDEPDTRRTPCRPYRPSRSDVGRPGRPAFDIVELPAVPTRRRLGFRPFAQVRRLRQHGRHRLDKTLEVGRASPPSDPFALRAERSVSAQRHPYLAFFHRTDGIIGREQSARLDVHLRELLHSPLGPRLRFLGPEDTVAAVARRSVRDPARCDDSSEGVDGHRNLSTSTEERHDR